MKIYHVSYQRSVYDSDQESEMISTSVNQILAACQNIMNAFVVGFICVDIWEDGEMINSHVWSNSTEMSKIEQYLENIDVKS